MKILHWAIILVIIVLPFSLVCRINVNAKFSALKDEARINNAVDTATKDAIDQIIMISQFDYHEEFGDVINITPALAQETINTFFNTLAVNYNIPYQASESSANFNDSSQSYIKNYFSTYVPAVMVVAYDGFYVYSLNQTSGGFKYQLSDKIPYSFSSSSGYSIGYTLGDDIILSKGSETYSGRIACNSLDEIKAAYNALGETDPEVVSLLTNDISVIMYAIQKKYPSVDFEDFLFPNDDEVTNFVQDYTKIDNDTYEIGPFHEKRREVIIDIISEKLTEEINVEHNRFADLVGVTYNFTFPTLSDQDWVNTIDDISFLAFIQGIPLGSAETTFYNNFAFGGSKIVRREYIYINKIDGINYYHTKNCKTICDENGILDDNKYNYITISKEDAISESYEAYPCLICN